MNTYTLYTSIEYIENLGIMMNWMILQFSRRVIEQKIVWIFNWYIFDLQGKAALLFPEGDCKFVQISVLLLSLKNVNIIQFTLYYVWN